MIVTDRVPDPVKEILGAVFNFIANMFIIPIYSIEGAAFTTVVSEVVAWIVYLIAVKNKTGINLANNNEKELVRTLVPDPVKDV